MKKKIFRILAIIICAFLINSAFFLFVPIINAIFFVQNSAESKSEKQVIREVEVLVKEQKQEVQKRTIREVPQSNRFAPSKSQSSLASNLKGFSIDLSLAGLGEEGVSIGAGVENVIYEISEVETEARILKETPANYPDRAKRQGIAGYVKIHLVIDRAGNVSESFAAYVDPPGYGFEREALAAIKQYKFSPALVGGVPVSQRAIKEFRFVP